jgi:hypothetical protein
MFSIYYDKKSRTSQLIIIILLRTCLCHGLTLIIFYIFSFQEITVIFSYFQWTRNRKNSCHIHTDKPTLQ